MITVERLRMTERPPVRSRRSVLPTLVVAALAGALGARFVVAGSGDRAATSVSTRTPPGATAESQVANLQDQLTASPNDPRLLTQLGVAYLGRARETADPTYYAKAAEAIGRSRQVGGDSAFTLTGAGLVDLSRHDFAAALEAGNQAHALTPDSPDPLGVIVDAHVELGQYDAAAVAAQEMVDRRPGLASLSRVSYLRELNGDTDGAVTAMTQAAVAGSSPADVAYVETIVGDLELGRGALTNAESAYRRALASQDGYANAQVGLAKVAAARGDLSDAATQLDQVVQRLPLPATVALLGDVEAALGRSAEAANQYALVRQIEALNTANGVAVDLELARFEADHSLDPGADPQTAVALARSALAQRPTIYGEDTLSWALRQAGQPTEALAHARAAVRLGTADAVIWYHLGAVESDLGLLDDAKAHVAKALAINPVLTVRDLGPATRLAHELGVAP